MIIYDNYNNFDIGHIKPWKASSRETTNGSSAENLSVPTRKDRSVLDLHLTSRPGELVEVHAFVDFDVKTVVHRTEC